MSDRISTKPDPAIFGRAKQAEEDLARAMSRMDEADQSMEKASRDRDQLAQSIAEMERQIQEITDEAAADVYSKFEGSRSNKETRDLAISQELRGNEKLGKLPNTRFLNLEKQLQELKVKHRNKSTDLDLANAAVKAAQKRVDGTMSLVRLIAAELDTLGKLFAYDTVIANKN